MWNTLAKVGICLLLAWGVLWLLSNIKPMPNYYKLAAESLERGKYKDAERFYRSALEQAEQKKEQYYKGVVHRGLGRVFLEQELYLAAEEEFQIAILEYAQVKGPHPANVEVQECFQFLGNVQLTLEKCSEAVATFENSLDYYRAAKAARDKPDDLDPFLDGEKLLQMAKAYHNAGNRCKNTSYYKKALFYLREGEAVPGGGSNDTYREKAAILKDAGLTEQEIEADRSQYIRGIH